MEVLFGSDVHDQPHMYEELVRLANESKVDLLAFGGDYVDMHAIGDRHLQQMQHVVQAVQAQGGPEEDLETLVQKELQNGLKSFVGDVAQEYGKVEAVLAKAKCPVIGIDGNHDVPNIAREVMKSMSFIDNGATMDFGGVKFGGAVNSYEQPSTAHNLQKYFGFPIDKLMPQLDDGNYSIHDAKTAAKLAEANPDIVIAHKPVGAELNMTHDGKPVPYGKVLDSYITQHGKTVWHGHWHGQVAPVKIGDSELPLFDHKGALNFRATPWTAWSFTIDDTTKKVSHVTFYEWKGEYQGQHYTSGQWKEFGGEIPKI